jgi:hypothetical protein
VIAVKKIMILGGAGRVGAQIASELMRCGQELVLVDIVPESLLAQMAGRLLNDARLASGAGTARISVYGGVDALDTAAVTAILATEKPNLVINYAIPITWDATKRLSNYATVSAAGLGAFTAIQVVTPLKVAEAIIASGIQTQYMVGNLPDLTIPVITGVARRGGVAQPLCGAGNVGLNQVAMRRQIALERDVDFDDVELSLVSHHVHWVAPREPGYSNAAPFMAKVEIGGRDVSESFEDLRAVMNRGVQNHYEAGAPFSSTTGILASRVAMALMDESGGEHRLHAPAPNGLPGGYPLLISGGQVSVDLPDEWHLDEAVATMKRCQPMDGVRDIREDGTVLFTDDARDILHAELGVDLPAKMDPSDIEEVARTQIAKLSECLQLAN